MCILAGVMHSILYWSCLAGYPLQYYALSTCGHYDRPLYQCVQWVTASDLLHPLRIRVAIWFALVNGIIQKCMTPLTSCDHSVETSAMGPHFNVCFLLCLVGTIQNFISFLGFQTPLRLSTSPPASAASSSTSALNSSNVRGSTAGLVIFRNHTLKLHHALAGT